MKKLTIVASLTALLCLAGAFILFPRFEQNRKAHLGAKEAVEKHKATWRLVSWAPSGPSFEVRGFSEVIEPKGNRPRIQLLCHWSTPPQPWDRYTLSFPGAEITYPDGSRAFPMISPLAGNDFVVHYFFDHYPARMAAITIPIGLVDTATRTNLGLRNLTFTYWPDESTGLTR